MEERKESGQPLDLIHRLMNGYQSAALLAAAAELDIFTPLIEEGIAVGVRRLAVKTGFDPRALEALLDGLTFLGLLEKVEIGPIEETPPGYRVAEGFVPYLDSRSPETMVPIMAHWGACLRSWSQLAHVVRTGFPAPKIAGTFGPEADDRHFVLGMDCVGAPLARIIADDLAGRFGPFEKMLDLGGASGTYTLAFLRRGIARSGIIFDRPIGITEARARLAGLKEPQLAEKIQTVAGNFYTDPFPEGCDLHWISAIIHQQDTKATAKMFAESLRTLAPGGTVAVRDIFPQKDRSQNAAAALFSVNMLVNTPSGRVDTLEEVRTLLEEAGFEEITLARPAEDMSAVVTARKP